MDYKTTAIAILTTLAGQAISQKYAQADDAAFFAQDHMRGVERKFRERILIERAIIRATVNDLIRAGYGVTVSYGDGDEEGDPITNSTDVGAIMKEIGACDEETLFVHRDGKKKPFAWIKLIYGNSGWDVVANMTSTLEDVLAPSTALAMAMGDEL